MLMWTQHWQKTVFLQDNSPTEVVESLLAVLLLKIPKVANDGTIAFSCRL